MIIRKRILDLVVVTLLTAAMLLLYFIKPAYWIYMPKCPWRALTHTNCPSCGNTRAAYHILHGHIIEGIKYNPFLMISLPLLLFVIWVYRFDTPTTLKIRRSTIISKLANAYVFLFVLWWILRNLIGM